MTHKPFQHGGNIFEFEERYGKVPCDFSSNMNLLGIPEVAKVAYLKAFSSCSNYPDPDCRVLKKKIAAFENVNYNNIVCGNGAADLIFGLARSLMPKRALIIGPAFSEYHKALNSVGCEIEYHFALEKNGFDIKDDVLDKIDGHDIVFMANPSNPTGNITDKSLIKKIAARCEKNLSILILDECFIGFTDCRQSFVKHINEYKNIVILKAFTKLFSMAGLRLGYAVTSNNLIIEKLYDVTQSWSVSVPAQACAEAVLSDNAYISRTIDAVELERKYLIENIKTFGAQVYGSKANYIFFHHKRYDLFINFAEKGFLIRDCANYDGLSRGYYRIAVKPHEDNERFLVAFKDIIINR